MTVRGKSYEREVIEPAPRMPHRVYVSSSRLRPTPVSFGLAGRLVCTCLAFVPLVMFLLRGTIFWLLAIVASVPAGAWWLWETWRRPNA